MLDTETKRRIDTCRDILVGKVPDPKSQVEQITIALIYKFMDDMDAEAEELGGERSFFTGEFARYGWSKLMAPGLGGHEMLSLYAEAIQRMNENPGIPALFRDIFKNAFLPYRDPETLRSFLKEINSFTYDHSERLGDAFEYLLSVLGSQGEAGQFRTPRHIIDFMVEIIDPKKDETILDPACGTAGFLISAYKHILKHNSTGYQEQQDREAYDEKGVPMEELALDNPLRYSGDQLTPDDRKRLATNIGGYDISPDMVRLSLVNMYLHGFTDPHIEEYDTLTSDEKWPELADVILANPPFMSPKGGIRPHNRFAVQSKRSEVLFVDYIAEHLTPNGRAAVVVPEGIIFQSQTAYKQLREMLLKGYLVAVISLPAGVFNPYSGVKTSILVLDNRLAKQRDEVLFVKIENDGFNLGAQRRPIDKNDLPEAVRSVKAFLQQGEVVDRRNVLAVSRERIGENGEWNFSGDRYRDAGFVTTEYELIPVGEFAKKVPSLDPREYPDETFELWSIPAFDAGMPEKLKGVEIGSHKKIVTNGDVLLSRIIPHIRRSWVVEPNPNSYRQIASTEWIVYSDDRVMPAYLRRILISDLFHQQFMQTITGVGGSLSRANPKAVAEIRVPVPPLEVQKEIVAEIEGYQKIIGGARQVVENYQPRIPIHPDWPMVELGEIIERLETGVSVNSENRQMVNGESGILKTSCVTSGEFTPSEHKAILPGELSRARCNPRADSIIISRMNTEALVGANAYVDRDYETLFLPDRLWQTVIARDDVKARYVQLVISSKEYREKISALCGGTSGSMKNIAKGQFLSLRIPLPSVDVQDGIITEIEAEQRLVDANKELIQRFEEKIKQTINRVWGGTD